MRRVRILPLLLAAAALLAHGGLRAQARPFVGAGAGVSLVGRADDDTGNTRPHLAGRFGLAVSPRLALTVEGAWYGIGDDPPSPTDLGAPGAARPEVLESYVVLLGAQASPLPGVHVRGGVGAGRHAYPVYLSDGDVVVYGLTKRESGLAAGAAAGTELALGRRLALSMEAFFTWSGGNDASGGRRVFGVQATPLWRF